MQAFAPERDWLNWKKVLLKMEGGEEEIEGWSFDLGIKDWNRS
jgi:hypothetical protein